MIVSAAEGIKIDSHDPVYFKVWIVFERICDLLHQMNYILDFYLKLLLKVWQHSKSRRWSEKRMFKAHANSTSSKEHFHFLLTGHIHTRETAVAQAVHLVFLYLLALSFSSFGRILANEAAKSSFVNSVRSGSHLVWWRTPVFIFHTLNWELNVCGFIFQSLRSALLLWHIL